MILLVAALALAHGDATRDLPGEVMPDRRWDFVHLDLQVKLDPDRGTVEGVATHTVEPLGRPAGWVRLHQVGLEILEVQVDGEAVEGWRVGDQTLDVPVQMRHGARQVSVRYRATPKTGMHFRGGPRSPDPVREVWTQGEYEDNRYWFPGWDYPNDRFTVATDVIVPDGLLAFANGELVGQRPEAAGWTRWSWRLDEPVVNYLVAVAAGEYAVYEDQSGSREGQEAVPLTYIVPRTVREEAARRTLAVAGDQLPWMAEQFGAPFPYPAYRQVVVSRFLYLGMENATLSVLADELLLSHPAVRDRRTELVVAHELAHQWFGDLLTCYGWRELWLNEGLATFWTGRWMEHRYGPERYAASVRGWMRDALHDPAPMAPRGWSKVPGRDNAAVYVRGAAVLHMLRVALGEQAFQAAIQAYVQDNAGRLVETEDLRRALEDHGGMHLGWLFDAWVHGAGHPVVETGWVVRDGAVEVTLHPITEGAPFSAPVEVELGFDDDVVRRRVWLGAGQTRLVVDLRGGRAPRWVAVDAPGGVLADWKHTQPVEAWAAQARHSPTPYARLVALEQLGEGQAVRPAVLALREVLRNRSIDRELRAAAARSLGKLGTTDALEILLAALTDEEPVVREAVVEGLGHAPPRSADQASNALARQVTADPDPYVRAQALQGLARTAPERAARLARQRLDRQDPTPEGAEHEAAMEILGKHGERADLRLLRARLGRHVPRPVRHAAARAAVRLHLSSEDGPERARQADATALEAALLDFLDSRDLRTRQLGVTLLAQVGDHAAEAALTVFARSAGVPELTEVAQDAAALIRQRRRPSPAPSPTAREDLQRMQQRLDALEERLHRLETWR